MTLNDTLILIGLLLILLGVGLLLYVQILGLILRLHLLLYPKVDAKFIQHQTKEPTE
jgi:hypothetical protein